MKFGKSKAVAWASGAMLAAALAGGTWVWYVQPARAAQGVADARQELASVPDLSSVFRKVAKAVEPSVVNINVHKTVKMSPSAFPNEDLFRRFFGERDPFDRMPGAGGRSEKFEQIGTGSGVIMDAGNGVGYVLTNNHVAGGADKLEITLSDGRKITDARVVGTDPKTDLAVVEIKASDLIPAKWGDSGQLQQGDRVMAFGSPFGYVGSMTHGIVSGLHRQAGILGQYGYEDFIQTDAPINPGNSGGPLVDIHGNVVGVNTAIASGNGGFQGIGFAIPADEAQHVYSLLKEHGKVVRGWLGVQIMDVSRVTAEAKSAGYDGKDGVLVRGVLRNAPAIDKLAAGDVITSVNGKAVKDSTQLRECVAQAAPGSEATFQVMRDGKALDIRVKLGEQPGSESAVAAVEAKHARNLGMELASPTDDAVRKCGMSSHDGAMVTAVEPGSLAARAGIQAGDVITRIGNQDIKSTADAGEALKKVDVKKGVRLLIVNNEGSEMLFMQSNG
ncbi:MAG: trypsin-like peptidase domain-containing protein [Tepidisphaerales bacterium]